ncbi:MAG: sigma-70 family RNA polymerase sigma factor [Candidatus Omnitrophota bacterium]
METQQPRESIEVLFKKYKRMIYAIAISISRNPNDAEDILQNVYLQALKHIDSFRGNSQVSTWLYKIAYNESLMYVRKKSRQLKLQGSFSRSGERNSSWLFVNWAKLPDKHLLDDELKSRIDAAVRSLPLKYRMPLLLHKVEGLALLESAQILGIKLNSLKTRLHRAYAMLKSEIVGYFEDRLQKQGKGNGKPQCGIWMSFIYDFVQDSFDDKRHASFNEHTRDCPECSGFLKEYGRSLTIMKALECGDIPAALRTKIESFLSKDKEK